MLYSGKQIKLSIHVYAFAGTMVNEGGMESN